MNLIVFINTRNVYLGVLFPEQKQSCLYMYLLYTLLREAEKKLFS